MMKRIAGIIAGFSSGHTSTVVLVIAVVLFLVLTLAYACTDVDVLGSKDRFVKDRIKEDQKQRQELIDAVSDSLVNKLKRVRDLDDDYIQLPAPQPYPVYRERPDVPAGAYRDSLRRALAERRYGGGSGSGE